MPGWMYTEPGIAKMEPPVQISSRRDSLRQPADTLASAQLIPLAGVADRPLNRPPPTLERHPGSDDVDSFRRTHSDISSPFAWVGVACHPIAGNLVRMDIHLHEVVPVN